jgi:hypothetical protein
MRPSGVYFRPCREIEDLGCMHIINAALQRFSVRRTGMARVREGGLSLADSWMALPASDILSKFD